MLLAILTASLSISTQSADNFQLEVKDGLLTLHANDVALDKVIRQIGEQAGFKTILSDDFDQSFLVNVTFENVAVEAAVERLVNDENRIILYAKESDNADKRVISQVWLLGFGDPSVVSAFNGNQSLNYIQKSTLTEENIKDHKMNRLTKILREDQRAQVRAMAASALGSLQDEKSVSALQSVLVDKNSLVRLEAISALGRIGGQQAVMVLGSLLLNTTVNMAERVKAAEALWYEGSETAIGYLNAGKLDETDSVRLASSKPPISSKSDAFSTFANDAQAQ